MHANTRRKRKQAGELTGRAVLFWLLGFFGIVFAINGVLVRMLRDADVKERLAREGADGVGSTPEQFAAFVRNEIAKWTRVVKETGATID